MGSKTDDMGEGVAEWASDRLTTSLTCTSLGKDDVWTRSEPACRLPTSFISIEYLRSVHAHLDYCRVCKQLTLSARPIEITFQPIIHTCITSIHGTKLSVFVVFCCTYNHLNQQCQDGYVRWPGQCTDVHICQTGLTRLILLWFSAYCLLSTLVIC